MRHGSRTTEAVAHVRQVLGPADPTLGRDHTDVARDDEARAALARIVATRPDERRRTRTHRRRWTVVAGTVLAVGVAAASADATGLVPTGVVKGLLRADSPYAVYGRIDAAHAQLLAEARTEKGDVVQWWEAPTTKGGWCTYDHYLRVRRDGTYKTEDGGEACGVDRTTPGPNEKLNAGYATWLTYAGVVGRAAKPAVQVRLTLPDGQRFTLPLNAKGYFMALFPHSLATDADLSRLSPAKVVALDANGHALAVRHL
jgi:hypothetical protein